MDDIESIDAIMVQVLNILFIEDSDSDADLLVRFLKKEGIAFISTRVWTKQAYLTALDENVFDLIIADHSLPQFSGMEAFHLAKELHHSIPFILVTGTVTENILTEYAKEGIGDYILKDNLLRLPSAIEHLLSKNKIEELLRKLEIAQKGIEDSIIYAKSIQNAMLPDTILLSDTFPESFIFLKPKDVLSGDFYWFKDDKESFYLAAADCTGHGIAGALMSMIGIEKLNNIVFFTKNPADILKHLSFNIKSALSQSTQYEHSQNGMDIALCSFNKITKTMIFSGAKRPLWIVRNNKTEIEVIAGSKKTIGGVITDINPNFDFHEIEFLKGDCFYLFSDGFADQFRAGGDEKITSRRFKELLISINSKSMNEQRDEISNYLNEWKDGAEQIDDILIIGVRV